MGVFFLEVDMSTQVQQANAGEQPLKLGTEVEVRDSRLDVYYYIDMKPFTTTVQRRRVDDKIEYIVEDEWTRLTAVTSLPLLKEMLAEDLERIASGFYD